MFKTCKRCKSLFLKDETDDTNPATELGDISSESIEEKSASELCKSCHEEPGLLCLAGLVK